jgi:hypothetical protein
MDRPLAEDLWTHAGSAAVIYQLGFAAEITLVGSAVLVESAVPISMEWRSHLSRDGVEQLVHPRSA